MNNIEDLKLYISRQHNGDEKQLEVIFTEAPRLIVEAPAGYGKTTTMISRIAYLFATGKIPNPKQILGLTFSVNAALKVKREISEKLPGLINAKNNPSLISEKATITNYHGFCKIILGKYGYLLYDSLKKDIALFKAIGDNEISKKTDISCFLSDEDNRIIYRIESQIKSGLFPQNEELQHYYEIISKYLLPFGYITHNAIILFTIELLTKHPNILFFYQNYYSLIIVDEFQDTNSIAWKLLELLISDKTQLLFLGDPLQRIYGFIGALPNIMKIATLKYNMLSISLNQNYRFRQNKEMLQLDANIRAIAESEFSDLINKNIASLPAFWGKSQEDEASQICKKITDILENDESVRVAILCRGRSQNSNIIEQTLNSFGINYFYGMFTDEDADYVDFHIKCQEQFIAKFEKNKNVNKQSLNSFVNGICKFYSKDSNKITLSLISLLKALVLKISVDYATISPEDKFVLLMDIFENRQLKQAMEYIESNVIITTIHGAKGLEWEYVFLPDIERWIFPNFYTCNNCNSKFSNLNKCKCTLPKVNSDEVKNLLLDELSVFYVGVTRAKKQIFASASGNRYNNTGQEKESGFSCLLNFNSIKLINANSL